MSVYLITYHLQQPVHEECTTTQSSESCSHEGCGCTSHASEHSAHSECSVDEQAHQHGEDCDCGDPNCTPGGDADYDLVLEIECLGKWAHFMPTSYLVSSKFTADEILEKLAPKVGARDLLFVSKVDANDLACLTPQVKEWIISVQ